MLKKLLATIAAAGLLATVAPLDQAEASTTAAVSVFLGDAAVGAGALAGDGLCFPGLVPSATACSLPSVLQLQKMVNEGVPLAPDNGFTFGAPSAVQLPNPPGGTIQGICAAAGVIGGAPVVDSSCAFNTSGLVTSVVEHTPGPTCGNSHGDGTGTFTISPDNGDPAVASGFTFQWISSAGGTLPVLGTFNVGNTGDNHQFASLVQARPLQSGACGSVPASTFTVVGVAVVAPVHVPAP